MDAWLVSKLTKNEHLRNWICMDALENGKTNQSRWLNMLATKYGSMLQDFKVFECLKNRNI